MGCWKDGWSWDVEIPGAIEGSVHNILSLINEKTPPG